MLHRFRWLARRGHEAAALVYQDHLRTDGRCHELAVFHDRFQFHARREPKFIAQLLWNDHTADLVDRNAHK